MHTDILPAHLNIQNIPLVNLALDEAVDAIECALSAARFTTIAFANADCANIAAINADYRSDLAAMDWIFIDGIGMRMAAKLQKTPVRDNVNGTDLFPRLCASLARSGKRIFLLGGEPGVAQAAADWAAAHHPGLRIAGTHHGFFTPGETHQIIETIRKSGADLLLVGFGAPRQESWINRFAGFTGVTVAMGVGGLFDYYSGRIPRAPMWMRKSGLEWLFRLIQEPGRLWRRYLVGNAVFLARSARQWCRDFWRSPRANTRSLP